MRNTLVAGALLFPLLAYAQAPAPVISPLRSVSPPTLARTAEFTFQVDGDYESPFDPDQIRVDAEVTGPTGQLWKVPAFWMEPCAMREDAAPTRFAGLTRIRFYIHESDFPAGKPVSFAISDMALVDSESGRRRALPELTDPGRWACWKSTVTTGPAQDGKPVLVVTIVPDGKAYPGISMTPDGDLADWSAYDTLQFRAKPLSGFKVVAQVPRLQIFRDRMSHRFNLFWRVYRKQEWMDCKWRYNYRLPVFSWAPPGKGEWRLRIAAPVAGDYTIALTAIDRAGTVAAAQPQSFRLDQTAGHGVIRVAPEWPRYLRYDSGKPFFSVGTNLLDFNRDFNRDFAEYMYYIDRFTNVGVNLFRVWLNQMNPQLHFENKVVGQYEPRECAAIDAVLNHADQRNATVMLCLLDCREFIEKKNDFKGLWHRSLYRTVSESAAGFFTTEAARRAFRKRLRYLVARWSASPAVHSWELCNEVNLTEAWRRAGEAGNVRAWHAEMAEYVRRVDPYDHLLTTSTFNYLDDPIWAQPLMELVMPHCYLIPRHYDPADEVDFASFIREPCLELARHGKPVIPGEFALKTVNFEDVVDGGVSIHNGLWATTMSGCAGTGITWYWDWIARHDYDHHFKGLAEFVKDVRWHEQAFTPIPDTELTITKPSVVNPTPGPVTLKLERHTWDATAPQNQPARIEVRRDGSMKPAGRLNTRLNGLGPHRDCHNPKTFVVNYPVPGRFVVSIDIVSGYGGANLHIYVDGEEKLFKDFVDEDEQLHDVIRAYRGGDYTVDVPAGKHEIKIDNTGKDWIALEKIWLDNYGPPKSGLQVMGLRGRDTVLLWFRNEDYTWFGNMAKQPCKLIEGTQLTVRGLPRGRHTVRFYDPQTAKWLGQRQHRTRWGRLKLELPGVRHDLAVVIHRDTRRWTIPFVGSLFR